MKTLKRLSLVSMFLVMLVVCFSQSGFTSEAAEPVYCYKYSAPALEATYNYLDEIYLKKYPEFGLTLHYGSPSDIQVIRNKAAEITKGCKTDAEKANAIVNWVNSNIKYFAATSNQFPIDVLINREADCMGFSHLISDMMRAVGITAVPINGYRGDMVGTVDEELISDWNFSGHAWVFAYINSTWEMYDVLFDEYSVTNADYISKWYLVMGIEGTIPYYDEINYKLQNHSSTVYKDGRFLTFNSNGLSDGSNITSTIINFTYDYQTYAKVQNASGTQDGYSYVVNPERRDCMKVGEAYSDGWISAGSMFRYMQPNGVTLTSTINERNGEYYYSNNYELTNGSDEYFLRNGHIVVCDGEYIPILPLSVKSAIKDGYAFSFESADELEEYEGFVRATIDENGKIHVAKDGYVVFDIVILNSEGNAICHDSVGFYVTKTADYARCEYKQHIYKTISSTKATLDEAGKIVKECIGCGKKKSIVVPQVATVKCSSKVIAYTGEALSPDIIVKDAKGNILDYGIDYTVKYKNNKKCGTATATVTFKGKYSGTKKLQFKIRPGNVSLLKTTSVTKTKVELDWNPPYDATGYRVYLYDSAKKKYIKIGDTKTNYFTVKNLTPGKKYKFAVKAYLKQGSKTYWSPDYVSITVATDLKKPVISKVTSGKKQVTLKIDKVKYATGYVIYMSTSKNGEYKKVATTTKTKYTVKKLKKNKKYYFKVKAYRKINGKKYYSNRSKAVSVRTTK